MKVSMWVSGAQGGQSCHAGTEVEDGQLERVESTLRRRGGGKGWRGGTQGMPAGVCHAKQISEILKHDAVTLKPTILCLRAKINLKRNKTIEILKHDAVTLEALFVTLKDLGVSNNKTVKQALV